MAIKKLSDFFVIAHRGVPEEIAENTIAGFEQALIRGANAIETDLCFTGDKQIVIWHDWNPHDMKSIARYQGWEGYPYIPKWKNTKQTIFQKNLADFRTDCCYENKNTKKTQKAISFQDFIDWIISYKNKDRLRHLFLDLKIPDTLSEVNQNDEENIFNHLISDFLKKLSSQLKGNFLEKNVCLMSPHERVIDKIAKELKENKNMSYHLSLDLTSEDREGALDLHSACDYADIGRLWPIERVEKFDWFDNFIEIIDEDQIIRNTRKQLQNVARKLTNNWQQKIFQAIKEIITTDSSDKKGEIRRNIFDNGLENFFPEEEFNNIRYDINVIIHTLEKMDKDKRDKCFHIFAKKRAIEKYICWTINDRELMKNLYFKRIDGIMTDRPFQLYDCIKKSSIDSFKKENYVKIIKLEKIADNHHHTIKLKIAEQTMICCLFFQQTGFGQWRKNSIINKEIRTADEFGNVTLNSVEHQRQFHYIYLNGHIEYVFRVKKEKYNERAGFFVSTKSMEEFKEDWINSRFREQKDRKLILL